MAGRGLHVGLNEVDPEHYDGWTGVLHACENDATAMERLTSELGYTTHTLLTSDATAESVLGHLEEAAAVLVAGDIMALTFAGHGDQLKDLDDDESDRRDETWLLYDREVLDDEIHAALAQFSPGVRVIIVSDSCHSGTVARRRLYADLVAKSDELTSQYARVGRRLRTPASRAAAARSRPQPRSVPPEVRRAVEQQHSRLYRRIRQATQRADEVNLKAAVGLLAACQDNQEAQEFGDHGAFTGALLDVWDDGGFTGGHIDFRMQIARRLPGTQSPNLTFLGSTGPAFIAQRPFTVEPPDPAEQSGPASGSVDAHGPVEISISATRDAVSVTVQARPLT
jgi:hypothetical protein